WVHEFLVCRGLVPGRKFDDHFIHLFTRVDRPWIMRALHRNSQWACAGGMPPTQALVGHDCSGGRALCWASASVPMAPVLVGGPLLRSTGHLGKEATVRKIEIGDVTID